MAERLVTSALTRVPATARERSNTDHVKRPSVVRMPSCFARSVHFQLEPVARDVQKVMEQQLWHWLENTHHLVRPLEASARGPAQVMERTRTLAGSSRSTSVAVVVKAVAVTLPPYRERASEVVEDEDVSWSRVQLVPDVSLLLWEQRRRRLRHVAGIVDVYTLASMLRDTREKRSRQTFGSPSGTDIEGAVRFCASFLGSSCDSTASGRIPMPILDGDELREHGWALDVAVQPPTIHRRGSRRGSTGSRSGSRSSLQAPLPHPTVFLFARDYVDDADVLSNILQERWGRGRLPVTVMPAWVNTTAVYGGNDVAAELATTPVLTENALDRLRRHVGRWLKGTSATDKVKKRAAERAVHTAPDMISASVAAALAKEDEHALSPHDAADIVWGICTALARLHRVGIIHGNLKPNNIFVYRQDSTSDSKEEEQTPRKVHLTDHLLPLLPDRLLEPGRVLKAEPTPAATASSGLPGPKTSKRAVMNGYVCLKLAEEIKRMPYMRGGGALESETVLPTFSLSGYCCISEAEGDLPNDDSVMLEGGVDSLSDAEYEALLLQHLAAPELVLLEVAAEERRTGAATSPSPFGTGKQSDKGCLRYRVWVDTQHVTPATDVYAVGVLLYTMMMGRLPPLPQYRRVTRGKLQSYTAAAEAHPAYTVVVTEVVRALFENAAQRKFKRDPAAMMVPLQEFLNSSLARANLPLVLALARAGVRPVTMELLIGMLHADPSRRLSLAQLQHHAFFRTYGRRRHAFRFEMVEAARRLQQVAPMTTSDSVRINSAAVVRRRMMPQNMGATAQSKVKHSHSSSARRTEAATPTTPPKKRNSDRSSSQCSGKDVDSLTRSAGPSVSEAHHALQSVSLESSTSENYDRRAPSSRERLLSSRAQSLEQVPPPISFFLSRPRSSSLPISQQRDSLRLHRSPQQHELLAVPLDASRSTLPPKPPHLSQAYRPSSRPMSGGGLHDDQGTTPGGGTSLLHRFGRNYPQLQSSPSTRCTTLNTSQAPYSVKKAPMFAAGPQPGPTAASHRSYTHCFSSRSASPITSVSVLAWVLLFVVRLRRRREFTALMRRMKHLRRRTTTIA